MYYWKYKNNAESEFKSIFDKVKTKCDILNIEISLLRRTNVQKNCCNVQENFPEDYFRISLFILFIDSFINELNERFLYYKTMLKNFTCLLPFSNDEFEEDNIKQLIEMYLPRWFELQ